MISGRFGEQIDIQTMTDKKRKMETVLHVSNIKEPIREKKK